MTTFRPPAPPMRILVLIAATLGPFGAPLFAHAIDSRDDAVPIGDPDHLRKSYEGWKKNAGSGLVLSLGWSKGLSAEYCDAEGAATIDLEEGTLEVAVRGLPATEDYDVWLVDNVAGEGRSVMPEPGDRHLKAGRLVEGELQVSLGRDLARRFEVDLVVVTRGGSTPEERGLLFGAPSLFQRLRTRSHLDPDMSNLVLQGERLFFNETFGGNGRTCGTCHPATNNFTIDTDFIAALPPDDPLFVAEFMPELAQHFENPSFMRRYALILVNADGFGDLPNRFVLRSVSHTLALPTSMEPSPFDASGGGGLPPFQRTGWSGDGAPGGGTLREFSIGAVRQHFTRSLRRTPNEDFSFPTERQLDALEAFMLALGRQKDLDLETLHLADPVDRAGLALFNGEGKCFQCHSNAGANAAIFEPAGTQNANFDTGIENGTRPSENDTRIPRDGGFGRARNLRGGFGNGRFNTPPLVEAADTPPFFHNGLERSIEEAVAFYSTRAFDRSPGAKLVGGIRLASEESREIASFLRALNALENIRSAISFEERARRATRSPNLLELAIFQIDDAIQVLEEGRRPRPAVRFLKRSILEARAALAAHRHEERNRRITSSIRSLRAARSTIEHVRTLPGPSPHPGAAIANHEAHPARELRVLPSSSGDSETVFFELSRSGSVSIDIFDVLGRRVATPYRGTLEAGEHQLRWNGLSFGRRVPQGIYFLRLSSPEQTQTTRLFHRGP